MENRDYCVTRSDLEELFNDDEYQKFVGFVEELLIRKDVGYVDGKGFFIKIEW